MEASFSQLREEFMMKMVMVLKIMYTRPMMNLIDSISQTDSSQLKKYTTPTMETYQ